MGSKPKVRSRSVVEGGSRTRPIARSSDLGSKTKRLERFWANSLLPPGDEVQLEGGPRPRRGASESLHLNSL